MVSRNSLDMFCRSVPRVNEYILQYDYGSKVNSIPSVYIHVLLGGDA